MIGQSKFEYGTFWMDGDRCFAANAMKYSKDEARRLYRQEVDDEPYKDSYKASVIYRVGWNEDNEKCAGWWLDFDHDGTEPRYCPVWVFEF